MKRRPGPLVPLLSVSSLGLSLLGASAVTAPAAAQSVPDRAPAEPAGQVEAPAAPPEICTDRPTKSNFACTVDAGHFQYEADIGVASFQRDHGTTTDTYLVTNPTFKYGVSKTLDLELNVSPYEVVTTHDAAGPRRTVAGIGDLFVRAKWNFLDAFDGKLLVSALPYVKLPTARRGIGDRDVEGGGLLPINWKPTEEFTVTVVPELDLLRDPVGGGYHANTAQLVNLGYGVTPKVTLYGELWADWNFTPARTVRQTSADFAMAWLVTDLFQLDAGFNVGLNRETPGLQISVGVSQKF